jgi:trehalose-phosphatase
MEWPFIADPRLSGRGDRFRGGLIVASNREPFSHRETARGLKPEVPAGGLVSALDTVLRVTGGTWVAWGSGSGDRDGADSAGRLWVPPQRPAYILRRVWLSPKGVANYYRGFCNLVLWPLFHGEGERIIYKEPFWDEYERSNRLFAKAILEEAGRDATVWVHDYHLCLVPRMLRKADPERTIAHFWHIPWPELQQFALLPHGAEIMAGLLGNDLIGFQIPIHARNFMECAVACLGATADYEGMTVTWQGRVIRVRTFPISTDFNRFDTLAGADSTAARAGRIREKYRLPRLVGLAGRRLFICLDFDGTLAPIVEKPELATMPDDIRAILLELKERYPVAVISGRSLEDLRGRAALPGIICLGNHGAEMEGVHPEVNDRGSLEEFLSAARQTFASIPGIQIEDKGVTASIHFRRVEPLLLGDFFVTFKGIAGEFAEKVGVTEGRKVFEIRPRGAAGKGDALRQLMEGVGKGKLPLYMGDDTSDEEAFRALRGAGISVAVGGSPEADYYLKNQGEVHTFLELLARIHNPDEKQRRGTDNGKGARQ